MKKCILLCMLMVSTSILAQETKNPVHQLRIYELTAKNKKVFHERFKTEAARIMKKYDFHIVSIWESSSEGKVEFVYLLEWKDEESLKQGWEKFMSDQEWKDIKKATSAKYGSFVENISDRTLILQDYSPQKHLLVQ